MNTKKVTRSLISIGAALRSLRDPIDTGSPTGRFSMHILGAVAELERALIIERTKAGAAAAARAGRMPGNPGLRARDPDTIQQLAAYRRTQHLERVHQVLDPWLTQIQAQRPAAWETIAKDIAAANGPNWSGERLRRTMHRLDTSLRHL